VSAASLPERWACALAARRFAATFVAFAVWTSIAIALAMGSRSADSEAVVGAFVVVLAFEIVGQVAFSRRLRARTEELERLLAGPVDATGLEPPGAAGDATRPAKPRTGRNPRSAAFLSTADPSAAFAKEVTVLIMWSLLVALGCRANALQMVTWAALAAFMAFERFGRYRALAWRQEQIDALRREWKRRLRAS
jgi:hypothetical protein